MRSAIGFLMIIIVVIILVMVSSGGVPDGNYEHDGEFRVIYMDPQRRFGGSYRALIENVKTGERVIPPTFLISAVSGDIIRYKQDGMKIQYWIVK